MATKDYDVFYTAPGEKDEVHCKVCKTLCIVRRGKMGATGWAEAIGRSKHLHDEFLCPHHNLPWHKKALKMVLAIEETPSKRLADLMRQDLEDILREHANL